MKKEICKKNINVTSMKESFILAYMNLHLNQDENMTNLQSLIGNIILKNQIEEKKRRDERQMINRMLKPCFSYDTLRSTAKYIQKVIDKEELIVFRFNSKWFIKISEKIYKRFELLPFRSLIDKKAIRLNKNRLDNFKIDTIIESIKTYRDIVICEKEINDYQEYLEGNLNHD